MLKRTRDGGGAGVIEFTGLIDTPSAYTDQAGKVPAVNGGESALEFIDAGDVAKVGTPVDNQVGVWTGDGTIEGESDLTFDGDVLSVIGQALSAQPSTLTPAGTTQTVDFDDGNGQVIDLGSASGNVTLTLSNPESGASYFIKFIQGATARTVILPSTVLLPDGSAPNTLTISTTDNAIDSLTLYYDGTN
ncbi:unnamed protein product, partial [marine sediment metagenome]